MKLPLQQITFVSLIVLSPALVSLAQAQGGVPLWTNAFGGGPIAVCSSGTIFVHGVVTGIGDATIAYSNDGMPLWTNWSVGGWNFAVDSSGNLFALSPSGLMKYS